MKDKEMRIMKDLREILSDKRFSHSLRVAGVARKLAEVYNGNMEYAYLAGLVHDIAKEYTMEENQFILGKYGVGGYDLEFENPKVIHADIGAILCEYEYQLPMEIVEAVGCHTLGRLSMCLLDKILFLADKIEPGKNYVGIEEERRLAYVDLDRAIILCIENNHKHLVETGKEIHTYSKLVLKDLKKNLK